MPKTPATVSGVVTLLACCASALAQGASVGPVKLNIAAQPLGKALNSWASQTGYQVVIPERVAQGRTAPSVNGSYTPEGALQILLASTDLKYQFVSPRVVTIRVAEVAGQDQRAASTPSATTNSTERHDTPLAVAPSRPRETQEAAVRDTTNGIPLSGSANKEVTQEVVVTAQKREERIHDVPISISALNGAALEKSSIQGVTDALNRIPGVVASMGAEGEGTQIGIRGVGAAGPLLNGSSPIAYYLDSVPFGLVRSGIAPDATIYDLQRIEVLRGPQGTLYGASAENGVVRVLTNPADLSRFGFKARATFSNTDNGSGNYRGDAAINVPVIDNKLAIRAVVGYEDAAGWIDTPFKQNANDSKQWTYRLRVDAQPTDELSIGVSLWSSRDDIGAPSTADELAQADHPSPDPLKTDYDMYGLKLGYQFSSFSLASMTSYLDYSNRFTLDLAPFGAPGLSLFADTPSHVFSQELILNSEDSGSPWRWSAGGFYRDASDRFSQTIPLLSFIDSSRSYALFGEVSRFVLDRKLRWTLGLRYFHDEVSTEKALTDPPPSSAKDSFNSTTPRAVLTWYPNEELTMYGSYSEGFRSGTPQYYTISLAAPNLAPLKPDKLHNYEVGLKADVLDRRLSLDTAVYYIDWRDVQQALLVPYQGVQINALVNGNSASGVGADFSVTARPVGGLELGLNFSWNDLTFDSDVLSGGAVLFRKGERLNFSSKYTGGAFAEYSFPMGGRGIRGVFSASANYVSKQSNRGAGYLAQGGDLTIARASFAISSAPHWSATLFGDNLSNEQDAIPAVYPVPYWYPRPRPRTVGLQLEYQF
jgi:iron complex outermembrane receptor protein